MLGGSVPPSPYNRRTWLRCPQRVMYKLSLLSTNVCKDERQRTSPDSVFRPPLSCVGLGFEQLVIGTRTFGPRAFSLHLVRQLGTLCRLSYVTRSSHLAVLAFTGNELV